MNFKRILSAAVAAAIALPIAGGSLNVFEGGSSYEITANAESTLKGEGTFKNPYLIGSVDDWKIFQKNIAEDKEIYAFYKLKNGLNLKSIADPTIGSLEHPFKGYFDGAHKDIYYEQNNGDKPAGLFGGIDHATIQNLYAYGVAEGGTHTAGLVIFASGSRNIIENCYVGTIVGIADPKTKGNQHIGGILGHASTSEVYMKNCVYAGSLRNEKDFVGGIIGWCDGKAKIRMQNCLFDGRCTSAASGAQFSPMIITYKEAAPNVSLVVDGCYTTLNASINEDYPDIVPKDEVTAVTTYPQLQFGGELYVAHRITHPYDQYFNDNGEQVSRDLMETDREFSAISGIGGISINSDDLPQVVLELNTNDDPYNYKAYEKASVRFVTTDANGNTIDGALPEKFDYTGDSLKNAILSGIRLNTKGSGDIPYQAVNYKIMRTDIYNTVVDDIKYPGSYAIRFTGKGEPDEGVNYTIGDYTYNFKVENTNNIPAPSPEQMFEDVLENGGAIKLEKQYLPGDSNPLLVPKGTNVCIDLNGQRLMLSPNSEKQNSLDIQGTLTVYDSKGYGCIGGYNTSVGPRQGGGINVLYGGTFELKSGSVAYNIKKDSGTVYVEKGGTFIMSGGSIDHNVCENHGSGVYVKDGGKFIMSGGTITKNKSNTYSGAVYFENENTEINISGNVNITNNSVDLTHFGLINITGKLDDAARIGISSTAYGKALTKGLSGKGSVGNFVCNDSEQELAAVKGELYIYEKGTAPVAVTTPAVTTKITTTSKVTTTTTTTAKTTKTDKKTTATSKTTTAVSTSKSTETTQTDVATTEETTETSESTKTTRTSAVSETTAATSKTETVGTTAETEAISEPVTETTGTASDIDLDDIMYGDVDLDKMIDLADITRLAKFLLSKTSYPLGNDTERSYKIALISADVNGDGDVGVLDLSKIIEFNLGNIKEEDLIPKK